MDRASIMTDEERVAAIQQGDLAAFKELVERYQKRVYAIAFGIVQNHDDAMDISQEVFVKVHRSLKNFKGQSRFYTWLYRIAVNLSIDFHRKQKRFRSVSIEDAPASNFAEGPNVQKQETADSILAQKELDAAVHRALRSLTPDHRAAMILREIEGRSYREISEILGCSIGTVMSRLHYARQRLRGLLKPFLERG
jgi:RNA polymerase sigma-70 factor, ECF subfamily